MGKSGGGEITTVPFILFSFSKHHLFSTRWSTFCSSSSVFFFIYSYSCSFRNTVMTHIIICQKIRAVFFVCAQEMLCRNHSKQRESLNLHFQKEPFVLLILKPCLLDFLHQVWMVDWLWGPVPAELSMVLRRFPHFCMDMFSSLQWKQFWWSSPPISIL